ncbi:hypothetical protein GIB67_008083 [Kingdonia uniflora]|uniref:Small ribosomal subunit protein mS29 n=1 Tax=Kingdonia uniflora TaxID=39325 RepID=A0A7J7MCL7_9MAGN|nr:hypothetical protein GIB67_008083 [Kingdonia uniflora]
MLQSIIRTVVTSIRTVNTSKLVVPAITKLSSCEYSSKASSKQSSKKKVQTTKSKTPTPKSFTIEDASNADDSKEPEIFRDENSRFHSLAREVNDKSLDVGPNGRPLFTDVPSISELTKKDTCFYMEFNDEELNAKFPEGLPSGILKEFEESRRSALLVRQSFLDLRDNFKHIVDPSLRTPGSKAPKLRKQIVLDGSVSCGKSIALSMLVHWARDEGWLVFYVPSAREWTHGGFYYKNPQTGLWDTPIQAAKILQDFLKFNESRLRQLPCQIFAPVPLGEGAGVGFKKGVDSIVVPEGSTLHDLIQAGITDTHAAVGVVVRLRKELSLVKDIPLLIAVDQYNSWFTFSEYYEAVTVRSVRQIHAKELATGNFCSMSHPNDKGVVTSPPSQATGLFILKPCGSPELFLKLWSGCFSFGDVRLNFENLRVSAFRSMMHRDMMVGAFSHSTAVGKLRKYLPDVPLDVRVDFPRYSLAEAATVSHYYLRQRLMQREAFSEENWKKIYYLANGNGAEMRWLAPFMRNNTQEEGLSSGHVPLAS